MLKFFQSLFGKSSGKEAVPPADTSQPIRPFDEVTLVRVALGKNGKGPSEDAGDEAPESEAAEAEETQS